MTSIPKNREEKQEFINPYKPLIYILPKDTSNFNQIASKTTNETDNSQIAKSDDNNLDIARFFRSLINIHYVTMPESVTRPESVLAVVFDSLMKTKDTATTVNELREQYFNAGIESDNSTISQDKMAQLLEKINLSNWEDFVEQIPLTSIPEELDFPPGHPLIGRFYRVHPLKKKNNKYIPVEQFDSILYKERESELSKILVDLGATEISVQELSSDKTRGSSKAEASLIGAGGGSSEIEGKNEQSSSADQVMKLNPKNWTPENFKSDEYSWLSYEPDWESIAHARLKGGCLSSSIELTSDTSFSISAQLGLTEGLLENLGSLGVGGGFSRSRKEKKRFEVKFVDV